MLALGSADRSVACLRWEPTQVAISVAACVNGGSWPGSWADTAVERFA